MGRFIEWSDVLSVGIEESDQQYGEYVIEAGLNPRFKKNSWSSRIWDHLHF